LELPSALGEPDCMSTLGEPVSMSALGEPVSMSVHLLIPLNPHGLKTLSSLLRTLRVRWMTSGETDLRLGKSVSSFNLFIYLEGKLLRYTE